MINEEIKNIKKFEKAGKIAAEARAFGKSLCKENVLCLEIAEKIEGRMRELGGEPAFPVDVSINYIAAHASPLEHDTTRLKKGDVVKLDIGVHVEGCVVDTAVSVEVGSNNNIKLIEAVEVALENAIKIVKDGVKVSEIGKVIQETIMKYGFSPIKNLSGHGLKEYEVHAGLTIPNYDNGDKRELKEGMIVAIEPFATNGVGEVKEGKKSGVYGLIEKKPVRVQSARAVLEHIEKNFKTLPFAARWLNKKFKNINFLLRVLENEGIIKQYSQLPEKSKGIVSQAEHSMIVEKDGVKILTK